MSFASLGYGAVLAVTFLMVVATRWSMTVPQSWLAALKKCGEEIEVEDGALLPNNNLFAAPEMRNTARYSALYASYIGLCLYRINDHGRLPYDAFFNVNVKPMAQIVYAAVLAAAALLTLLPIKMTEMFDEYRIQIIVFNLLPLLFLGIFATYLLPVASSKALKYPMRIDDDKYESAADDESYLHEVQIYSQNIRADGKSSTHSR